LDGKPFGTAAPQCGWFDLRWENGTVPRFKPVKKLKQPQWAAAVPGELVLTRQWNDLKNLQYL